MRKTILTLLLVLSLLPAAAQVSTATLGGRIVDENGPIEGVTVVAIHQQTNAQYYATTGRGGWYQLLDMLPGGPYTVRIHYFGYNPLTVRNLYTYAGQNTVVDADLEAGTTSVHTDEAATSLRIGVDLGGGVVPVSPLGYDLVGQRTYTAVPFDVRQETALTSVSRLQLTPAGSNRLHASAYGFFGAMPTDDSRRADVVTCDNPLVSGLFGLALSTPLVSEDYQLFAGLQYSGVEGLSGAGRFDARFNESNRLDVSGERLSAEDAWGTAGFTTSLMDGHASNRAQALWSRDLSGSRFLASDDFTLTAGRQRMLFGTQFLQDTAARFDFYAQDAVRFGQRVTLVAGVRFSFPFSFSPRLSVYYDVLGTGAVVLRAGTAVYGRHGEGSVWKNLAAVDLRLPASFRLSLEGMYGQSWRRLFYISTHNVLESRYALTARLERPFADNLWAVASYTRSDGAITDRVLAGFSYKLPYLGRLATTLAVLYDGHGLSTASFSWSNGVEARLSQDLALTFGGRDHTFQLTAYARLADGGAQLLAGLRYLL